MRYRPDASRLVHKREGRDVGARVSVWQRAMETIREAEIKRAVENYERAQTACEMWRSFQMAKVSTEKLSEDVLETRGYIIHRVQVWNQHGRNYEDLFGFADVIAVHPDFAGVLLVQATTRDNMSARQKKIMGSEKAKVCLQAGNRIEVWGWKDGHVKIRSITLADFGLIHQPQTGDSHYRAESVAASPELFSRL